MTLDGRATPAATAAYAAKFAGKLSSDFFSKTTTGLTISSIGLGTYLGEEDPETDEGYEEAILTALESGINHVDAAINYRSMLSERCVGRALATAIDEGTERDAIVIATKGGYVPADADTPGRGGRSLVDGMVKSGKIKPADLAKGTHCLAPRWMEEMLARSLQNLQLATIDVYYLHNPETQLAAGVSKADFLARCRGAFEVLEDARKKGKIVAYGTATWNGYRRALGAPDALDLEKLVAEAKAAAKSDDHGFKWVQLPVNIDMAEAYAKKTQELAGQPVSLLEAAAKLGITVVTSGTIGQAALAQGLPSRAQKAPWPAQAKTPASRAILWVRSIPGVTTALVGTSQAAHVRENLTAGAAAKLAPDAVKALAPTF